MNKEEMSIYLQNIDEYIFEENKIVTYQWLCKSLDIHVNISKQLLYTYANQESKKSELSLTHLLAGVPKNGVGYCIIVVKDDNLLEAKKDFQTITSEHVYSVQKLNAISDLNILYTVDISDDHKNNNYKRLSSIDFDSVERDSAVVAVLRAEALPTPSKQPIAALKKPPPKPIEKSPRKQLSPKKTTSPSKQTSPKKESSDNKGQVKKNDNKPTVASMFAKAAANKKPPAASNAAPVAVKDTKPKSKGIGAFFNKAPSKPKDETIINKNEKTSCIKMEVDEDIPVVSTKKITKDIEKETESKKAVEDKPDVSKKKEISTKSETKEKNAKQSQSAAKVKESKGKKRVKKSNDKEKVVKKRKRIVVMSDSESSSDEVESDHMERESTPPPQPTVIDEVEDEDEDFIEATPQPISKRHRRRLVDKTHTDSDGFLYTKKEYVTESCSDEEDTKVIKEDENKNKDEEKEVKEEEEKENKEDKKEAVKKEKETKPKRKTPKVESAIKTISKTVTRKQTSPQKKKQTNLMTFFNKK